MQLPRTQDHSTRSNRSTKSTNLPAWPKKERKESKNKIDGPWCTAIDRNSDSN